MFRYAVFWYACIESYTIIFILLTKHYIKEITPTIVVLINSDVIAMDCSRPSTYKVWRFITRSNLVTFELDALEIILHLVIILIYHLIDYSLTIFAFYLVNIACESLSNTITLDKHFNLHILSI